MKNKHSFFYRNGLTLVLILLFLCSFVGQIYTGLHEYNQERGEYAQGKVSLLYYLSSGHFLQATFENWESEFLQMALFVALTISFRQKGSSESKKDKGPEEVDREPSAKRKDAPWPVKKGGIYLKIYNHSLTIALLILFLISFVLHFYGSIKNENEDQVLKGLPPETFGQYIFSSRFWFESFQNWQSEFLPVFAIVVLSVFLRQKGSPQSKPVDAPNYETE